MQTVRASTAWLRRLRMRTLMKSTSSEATVNGTTTMTGITLNVSPTAIPTTASTKSRGDIVLRMFVAIVKNAVQCDIPLSDT